MTEQVSNGKPNFFNILPIVTGKGEEAFLPQFLHSLMETGRCCFSNPRKIGQLTPRSESNQLKMVQTGKKLTSRQETIGLIARRFLQEDKANLVILVDDLEDRGEQIQGVFETYRNALDTMLVSVDLQSRASVHFMVTMIEAYYFNDANAINAVLGTELNDFDGDPESIRNPKSELKQHYQSRGREFGFKEVEHGREIVNQLNLPKVLSDPNTCRSLRTLVKWCSRKIGNPDTEQFQLLDGEVCEVTGSQIQPAE